MALNGWEQIEGTTVELLRAGSDPTKYDVEYEVEYSVFRRGTSVDGVEYRGELTTATVTYYPTANAVGIKVEWKDLSEEAKKRIDAATKEEFDAISARDDRDSWLNERGYF